MTSSIRRQHTAPHRYGFTLVEMMVSVALVLIMMSMFANVFVMSTKSLSQQRGIAENDQRSRLLVMTIRGDLDERTFRDVLPFRANEDTRQLGHSLARRAGYFEIDEGNPNDPTDDVLSFTASVNIRLQNKDASPFIGNAAVLSTTLITNITSSNSITINTSYIPYVAIGSQVCISQSDFNNGCYVVASTNSTTGVITLTPSALSTTSNSYNTTSYGYVSISASEPDGDDGVYGNGKAASSLAEVCYFLRNGNLYRRVLLIRDVAAGVTAQPTYSTSTPIFWNNGSAANSWNSISNTEAYSPTSSSTTFWRDFDYSAFYYPGNGAAMAPGVRFHNATEALSNSNQSAQTLANSSSMITNPSMATPTLPFSLGIPHWRFGHSTTNGLPQDSSTTAKLSGNAVLIGRFNLQECSNSTFGYPGNISNGNPFDNQSLVVDSTIGTSTSGLVTNFDGQPYRRGEDILLANVLTFDVKVWDALSNQFVDIGGNATVMVNGSAVPGPLSANTGVWFDNSYPNPGSSATTTQGNIVGGQLNSTYGTGATNNTNIPNSYLNHYRFDTWHPNAAIIATTGSPVTGSVFYNEPPYYQPPPYYVNNPSAIPNPPYIYNEPPYVPVMLNLNQSNLLAHPPVYSFQATPLSAIQIKINFHDVSSNQVRQVTIIQSLVDQVKTTSITNESPEE